MKSKNVTLLSVSSLGVSATAFGAINFVANPVTLDTDGDIWYLEGGSSGTALARLDSWSSVTTFTVGSSTYTSSYRYAYFPSPAYNNLKIALDGSNRVASLAEGVEISASLLTNADSGLTLTSSSGPGWHWRQFLFGEAGFIAFEFDSGNGVQYGWANVTLNVGQITINSWAWADAGETLTVGQTESTPAVPEPKETMAALGLLAAGAAGMRRYLASRKSAA
ncbi:MAG: hypothetical protein Q7P63_06965 [Verrucomicrobiota bacterium JB022]|nr:hypothetical protein [Verrucomicrobiota bacterium JB022]